MQYDEIAVGRVLSAVALLGGAGTLFIVQQNHATASAGGRDISAVWPVGAALLVLGVLGFSKIRAAVYLLAFLAALLGAALVFVGLTTPFPAALAPLIIGLMLLAPAALLLRSLLRRSKSVEE